MWKNPRTTIAGIAAVATFAGLVGHMYVTGMWDPQQIGNAVMGLLVGLGLVAAKDA
jgi:hypothetical protein